MKMKKPHCDFCAKDLQSFLVDGSVLGLDEVADFTFDVTLKSRNDSVEAAPVTLQRDSFSQTTNPLRYIALIENWVEEAGTYVRCPFCTKAVKLLHVAPKVAPTQPVGNPGNPPNPLQQMFSQMQPGNVPQFGSGSNFGNNMPAVRNILSSLSDADLTTILTDLCIATTPNPTSNDLLDLLMDYLYN